MDEFEKIKTFSEGLNAREQNINASAEQGQTPPDLNLPQYLSQFRAVPPTQEEKESNHLIWIVLGLCAVIGAGAAAALLYRLPKMEETEIVVISPTPNPVKVLPENPGGLNIPDKDKVVYNRANETVAMPVVETLFPEAEQPVLPEKVIEAENKAEDLVLEELPVRAPVPEVKPVQNIDKKEVLKQEEKAKPQEKGATKAEPVAKAVPATTAEPKVTWRAQLLSSSNKANVEASWKTISKQQKALLSDMPYQIVSATIAGKGTFWRLQVGEFATKEMVLNLCAKLKKKKQDCIAVK